ncbi:MAG: hypothetical protein GY710_08655 [Desulfobacteraceae bacterium]|nr:hypothetical protein [Desulfobacteraceae bacterium]
MLLESSILGGVTGLIGTIWSSYNQRKIKALEMEDRDKQRSHEVSMVKAESDAMIAESQAQIQITTARVGGEIELAETQAFAGSLEAGRGKIFDASYMDRLFEVKGWVRFLSIPAGVFLAIFFGFVDFTKEMARPGITVYLLGLSTWITAKAWALLSRMNLAVMTPNLAMGIVSDAINVVLYLTVTAVTWWFGDRMAAKGLAKNLKLRSL